MRGSERCGVTCSEGPQLDVDRPSPLEVDSFKHASAFSQKHNEGTRVMLRLRANKMGVVTKTNVTVIFLSRRIHV